jgi:hypothetical protein
MQYFEHPKDYDPLDILIDLESVLENVDEVLEVRILGGDAFMHREWPLSVRYLLRQEKVHRVVIYTNGVIIPKERDLKFLVHPKVIVAMTDYGKLSASTGILTGAFRQMGIFYKVSRPREWIDCGTIKKHDRTPMQNDRLFRNCVATNLITLVDGRLFRCPFAASAFKLGVTTDTPSDYLNVATASKRALNDYIMSDKAMSACDFCTSRILTNKIPPAIQTKEALKI